eukprot:5618973-Lingulodinium_polyedra.AAC.1
MLTGGRTGYQSNAWAEADGCAGGDFNGPARHGHGGARGRHRVERAGAAGQAQLNAAPRGAGREVVQNGPPEAW